jgi:hypothetical protein
MTNGAARLVRQPACRPAGMDRLAIEGKTLPLTAAVTNIRRQNGGVLFNLF